MKDTAATPPLLEPFDTLLVDRLARVGGEADSGRRRLLSHAVRAMREAHPCLTPTLHARVVDVDEAVVAAEFAALTQSPLVASAEQESVHPTGRPFVLDSANRLYLARYFAHERALAARIVHLATSRPSFAGEPSITLVDRLFPALPGAERDAQRDAALHACRAALTIISGGPGTGKTSTVVKVLALLVDAALRAKQRPPRVALVAPTGKAAARLGESIRAALERLPVDGETRSEIPTKATTIHSALQVHPAGGFRRGLDKPLEADLVLVDEASMVDLALMRALVEAVPSGARLVLLGDRDQLASVEAGSVLADLCAAASEVDSPLASVLCELTKSHRFTSRSGIGSLAAAIRANDADAALAILNDPNIPDVSLEQPVPSAGRIPRTLQASARDGYAGLLEGSSIARLAALGNYRVLTPHRRGALGVTQLGQRIAAAIGRETGAHAIGTPVLVLENDPETGLANGDVGVVVAGPAGDDGASHAHAAFESDAGVRTLGAGRLPAHEACWAMSIHKSQGSEFDVVSVVLPEASAIASRELLYTAVTRARESVFVHASEAAFRRCVETTVVRATGLVDAILSVETR